MRIAIAMIGAATTFLIVFVFATTIGSLVVREAVHVGYALLSDNTSIVYLGGQASMVANLMHAFAWAALSARSVFRNIGTP